MSKIAIVTDIFLLYIIRTTAIVYTVGINELTNWLRSANELYRPSDAACRRS
jgi:phage antirepressor YoqD-like protein